MKQRHLALAVALGLTLLAVWLTDDAKKPSTATEVVAAVERPANLSAMQSAAAPTSADDQRLSDSAFDLFAPRDWNPPPPPTPVKATKPEPPPLPYRYLGRWEENGVLTLILGHGDISIPVHNGQTLDGQWRIDRIAARQIDFTFLPLNTRAHLALEEPPK